ncbi:head maturation protease, ClpP-related [Ralstonia wenshanensis]|uniref:ATP-dependent Clp protease proteolytic subunit n=1 Tax=Ralstonia wenshanensis TaxID=2842456 RepID=A0AAD2ELG3_9RALS|nr:head maturation protease, ClpP-related [Ralstonia wenshanensis]MDY7507233.1 Clp protease ClpP [Ralstonia wenshanensis]CAJ0690632.1 ATP-dependent Clp protease proteolytic subunit [Ralstonia wenshanensis]
MKAKQRKWYDLKAARNAAGKTVAELRIYDDIGFWGTTAKAFVNELDAVAKDADEILVAVNSGGGDVFDGFAIYNALRRYSGKVTARVDGIAASAASLVVMAGDTIVMPENAMMMIHNAWTIAAGDAAQMRKTAELLDKTRDGIVAAYRNKCGLTDDEIVAMMDAETWMTAGEAKDRGFADQIEAPVKLQASVRTEELLARFEHTPEALLKALEAPPAEPPQAAAPAAPVATTPPPDPGALAQHAFAACRAAGLPQLAEAVVASSALASAEAIDAVVARAKDIAGLCTAAHLPELAAQFVADGLNADQVRARLYDRVMASSTPGLSNRQPVAGQETIERKTGPHGPSIYSARRKKTASAFA